MLKITKEKVKSAFSSINIERGDGVMVHSELPVLGIIDGGLDVYYDAIMETIGEEGTLVVPTFNFSFARGVPFDQESTPSENMGVFSEYVRVCKKSFRSQHPMQSVCAVGKYAVDIAERDTSSAFDKHSSFDRMVELNFKLLFLGASIKSSSLIHYCEQRNNVPYRYWKRFEGEIRKIGVPVHKKQYDMFVRNMHIDPIVDPSPVESALKSSGLWNSVDVNYGKISCCRMKDFVNAANALLEQDKWALVTNKPNF